MPRSEPKDKVTAKECTSENTDDVRHVLWKEKQTKESIIEKGVKGRVKWYNVRYHYEFIARDDKENDVFVHQTAIKKSRTTKYYLRTLGDGEEELFDIVEGKQGPEADNVTGANGADVRGSRYYNLQFYSFRRHLAFNRERAQKVEVPTKLKNPTDRYIPLRQGIKPRRYPRVSTEEKGVDEYNLA